MGTSVLARRKRNAARPITEAGVATGAVRGQCDRRGSHLWEAAAGSRCGQPLRAAAVRAAGADAWLAPGPLFVLMLAVAAGLLAGLVRSGSHAAWVAAVTCEATLTLVGLVRVATGQYAGGSLLAIATLGLLVHPAAGRAFDATARVSEQSLAENPGGAIGGGAGQASARRRLGAG